MMTYEGAEVAEWLNGLGISAFVLRYRVAPRYRYPAPMQDITRAIRLVRSRADEWKISRVGVLGFSAGGHLASYAMTHFDDGNEKAEDLIERAGSRPDFGVLVYPVVSMDPPYGHAGSRKNLLGKSEAPEELSTDKCVTEKTPPCFLVHTSGDTAVPVENSIAFYLALRKAKVPAELHVYEKGEHGYGLGKKDPVLSTWPERCAAWFKSRGY
jgi:acetyl esterase/lipase